MTGIEINGTSLATVEVGSGPPLVLVHGSASDHRTWQGQRDVLAEHFRVIAYSRRYHWPNQPIAEGSDYSMIEHLDDLEEILHRLGAAPAHLVGHSYGAFVCLLLAIRAPQLARTLVLAEPPAITLFVSSQPRPPELLKLLVRRPRTAVAIIRFAARGVVPATAAARRGDLEEVIRASGRAILGPQAFDRLSTSRLEQVRANTFAAEFLGSGFAPLAADEVRAVRAPALLLEGDRSPSLFHRVLERLEELLPQSERVTIPGASHIQHEDNPTAYNSAVLSFLLEHEPGPD